jgi:hypothetical protein
MQDRPLLATGVIQRLESFNIPVFTADPRIMDWVRKTSYHGSIG